MKETFFSPAKVNLFFRVLKKREDGFHDIATLMQAVSLGDTLTFEIFPHKKGADIFLSNAPFLSFDASNLIIQALELFRKTTKRDDFSVCITLNKRIPIMAGLGGGSSNAATTLWALNQLLQTKLSLAMLEKMGASLGCDVPFFFSSGVAFCQGKGEKITPCSCLPLESFYLVKPKNISLSTPFVYKHCLPNVFSKRSPEEILLSFQNQKPIFLNELEFSAFKLMPKLKIFKDRLYQAGFHSAVMTGSGSAFAAFGEKTLALKASWLKKVFPIYKEKTKWYTEHSYHKLTSSSS